MHEEMKMEIEELHKEIDLVQGCINRMAQNSFHIKGWTVTIFAVVLALLPEKIAPTHAILLGGVMLATSIMLWYMDSFFLTAEKNYRQIYSWILKERPNGNRQLQYELDFNKYESEAKLSQSSQRDVAFSKTLKCFYGMLLVFIRFMQSCNGRKALFKYVLIHQEQWNCLIVPQASITL